MMSYSIWRIATLLMIVALTFMTACGTLGPHYRTTYENRDFIISNSDGSDDVFIVVTNPDSDAGVLVHSLDGQNCLAHPEYRRWQTAEMKSRADTLRVVQESISNSRTKDEVLDQNRIVLGTRTGSHTLSLSLVSVLGTVGKLVSNRVEFSFVLNSPGQYTVRVEAPKPSHVAWQATSPDGKKGILTLRADSPIGLPDNLRLSDSEPVDYHFKISLIDEHGGTVATKSGHEKLRIQSLGAG